MHGDGPSQFQWKLDVGAQFLLVNLLLFFVVCIFDVAPGFSLYVVLITFLGVDSENTVFLRYACDDSQSAVHPPFLHVVLDEEYLSAHFQFKFHGHGQTAVGEFAFDLSIENRR